MFMEPLMIIQKELFLEVRLVLNQKQNIGMVQVGLKLQIFQQEDHMVQAVGVKQLLYVLEENHLLLLQTQKNLQQQQ